MPDNLSHWTLTARAVDGTYEYVLVLGVGCLALVLAGAGRFSLDALALRGTQRPGWRRQMRTIAQR